MRRGIVLGWLLAVAILPALHDRLSAAEPEARVLTYRVEPLHGEKAPSHKVLCEVVCKLTNRWRAADLDTVTADIATTDDRVFVRLPRSSTKDEPAVRRLTQDRGLVEFRVRATKKFEDDWASRVERYAAVPEGWAWIPEGRQGERRKILVETPADEPLFTNADVASVTFAWIQGFS